MMHHIRARSSLGHANVLLCFALVSSIDWAADGGVLARQHESLHVILGGLVVNTSAFIKVLPYFL